MALSSGIRLELGAFAFPLGQVAYIPKLTTRLNSRGNPVSRTMRIELDGDIIADGPSNNVAQRLLLEAASGIPNQDFALKTDRGVQLLRYRAADAMRGFTVTELDWPNPNDGQLVTMSTFKMVVEAEYKYFRLAAGDTIEFTESINQSGQGVSQFAFMYPINARPVSYQARKFTTTKYVQQGNAIGWGAYPRRIPPPFTLNPKYYMSEQTQILRGNAQGSGLMFYPISWAYYFEFDYQPTGIFPSAWPAR